MSHFNARSAFEKALQEVQKEGWKVIPIKPEDATYPNEEEFEEDHTEHERGLFDQKVEQTREECDRCHKDDDSKNGGDCARPKCKKPKDCDKCFETVNTVLTKLYGKLGEILCDKLCSPDAKFEDLMGPESIARKIIDRAIDKIQLIERYEEDPCICKELVDSIGTLACDYACLAIKCDHVHELYELFEEGLCALLRRPKDRPRKHRRHHQRKPKWPTHRKYDESSFENDSYSDSCEVNRHVYDGHGKSRRYTTKY